MCYSTCMSNGHDNTDTNQGSKTMAARTYVNGDAATYTGDSMVTGGLVFFEVKIIEGHRKGDTAWTPTPSGSAVADHKAHIYVK